MVVGLCHSVFSSLVAKKTAKPQGEKTKIRHAKERKYEITPGEMMKYT